MLAACLASAIVVGLCVPSAKGGETINLPVPRVTIYPGDTIASDVLVDRAFIASTVARSSVLDDRQSLAGKVARRTLLAGQPIPVNGVRDPYLVASGKEAVAVFQSGGLVITARAIALQSGSVGDVISLRNTESGVTIRGTVQGDGTVRVDAP